MTDHVRFFCLSFGREDDFVFLQTRGQLFIQQYIVALNAVSSTELVLIPALKFNPR